ncbi:hypothetical protein EST38_g10571 [Candolleomyces aberdarensis]|uniref:prolyl aminopeptidase n=1 Tax=Candolleomyces aberdarensis TaxID=2316362 RepID=A0A4Q2D9Y0_9AGAR|nr:hypothetical protein EST38_g10571 [Candolleomyces aberdarensis]
MYPPIEPYFIGKLKVSDIHELYYEISGNKDGTPVVFLHGGPGGGTSPGDRSFFNPDKYKIILFDQRGSGKSTPTASVEDNTTWDLVKDIEVLREKLGVDKWHVFGGSWGSTLSLAELAFFYQEGTSHLFPEAWEEFVAPIPEEERHDMILAYHAQLNSVDEETRLRAAKAWSKWEMTVSKLYVDPAYIALAANDDFSTLENHYFINSGFMKEGQLLEKQSIDKIRHIPTVVVQGRYDVCCPATTAHALKKAFPELTLHIVPDAGHSASEPGTAKLLVEATDKLADL